MKRNRKIMTIILAVTAILLVLLVAVFVRYGFQLNELGKKDLNTLVIREAGLEGPVYVTKIVWGLTGDSRQVILSGRPKATGKYDPGKDYLYEGLLPVFYEVRDGSLHLFSSQLSPVPKNFESPVSIVQVKLSIPELRELDADHSRRGITKIDF